MMGTDRIRVGFVQITEHMEHRLYLPYTAGLLQAYVETHARRPERFTFLKPIYLRAGIDTLVQKLQTAQVVGLSVHVWNCAFSLEIARQLRTRRPEILIVVGGPHVPTDPEAFLRRHPWIDVACNGHGEIAFLKLLEAFPSRDWSGIAGLSWLDPEGHFHGQGSGERVLDINATPSPFLNGYFDRLIADHPQQKWMSVWESNRGCPFSCTFCDWGAALGSKVLRFDLERVKQEITWMGSRKIEFLFCMDANFGILPRDLEIAGCMAETKARYGYPLKSVVQMTKNQADRAFETYRTLHRAELLPSAALSLQTTSPDALSAIKRENISLQVYQDLLKRFISADIPTYTDILIGLPGETYASFLDTVGTIITQGQLDELRFWNTYVLPNAEMASAAYRAQYQLETLTIPYLQPYSPVRPPVESIQEEIELLVSHAGMTRQDWVKMRALAWLSQTLYWENFLQLPLVLIAGLTPVRHQDLLTAFLEGPLPQQGEQLSKLRSFLFYKAQSMLQGQPEYTPGKDPSSSTPIWLPTQIFLLNEILYSPQLDLFFAEVHTLLSHVLAAQNAHLPEGLLVEALILAQALFLSRLPAWQGFSLDLHYNLWEVFQALRKGQPYRLELGAFRVQHRPSETGEMLISQLRAQPRPEPISGLAP